MSRWLVLFTMVALSTTKCGLVNRPQSVPATTGEQADTLRGIVRIVGAEPAVSIVLEVGGATFVTLRGDRALLEQLSGIEVTVSGERQSPSTFQAQRVAVRAVDGITAIDGVLRHDRSGYALLTAEGVQLPVPHLPAALRSRVGARIWLAGPLDRPPESYGVIQ